MHAEVNLARHQGAIEFLGPQSLATDLGERPIQGGGEVRRRRAGDVRVGGRYGRVDWAGVRSGRCPGSVDVDAPPTRYESLPPAAHYEPPGGRIHPDPSQQSSIWRDFADLFLGGVRRITLTDADRQEARLSVTYQSGPAYRFGPLVLRVHPGDCLRLTLRNAIGEGAGDEVGDAVHLLDRRVDALALGLGFQHGALLCLGPPVLHLVGYPQVV